MNNPDHTDFDELESRAITLQSMNTGEALQFVSSIDGKDWTGIVARAALAEYGTVDRVPEPLRAILGA